MKLNKDADGDIQWFDSLDDAKEDGYFPVKVTSLLQFYTFKKGTLPEIKSQVKEYAQNLIEESIRLGRDKPLSMATAISAAKEHYNIPETENNLEIIKRNIEPLRYLHYVVYAASDKRYYFNLFRHCLLEDLFFYVHDNEEMQHLRKFVEDGTVTLLMSKQQVMDTTALLTRLWSANLTGEGKLSYIIYLQIMEKTLLLEDYKGHGRELTGYKTVCNKMELEIADLWKQASEMKK